jgi:serine/threonine protein kinase
VSTDNTKRAAPSVDTGLLALGSVVQGYRIVSLIRAGRVNNVYVAESVQSQERVALKEYFPRALGRRLPSGRIGIASDANKQQFEAGVRGFINEAIALSAIKSDLLVQFVAAFREFGTAYVVTKFETGQTLEDWSRVYFKGEGVGPSEADLRVIFWMLLHAVSAMHEKGYLHLDIKPSNVILKDKHSPILIDLGGARRFPEAAGPEISVSTYTKGFAAPEQCDNKRSLFGPGTDIYGIGASILYCMTERVPPHATDRRRDDTLSRLLDRCRGRYSDDLIVLVDHCMALDLSARHCDVQKLQNVIASS